MTARCPLSKLFSKDSSHRWQPVTAWEVQCTRPGNRRRSSKKQEPKFERKKSANDRVFLAVMAASPIAVDGGNMPPEDKWDHPNDTMVAAPDDNVAPNGGGSHPGDEHHSSHQQPPEDSNDYNMRGESAAAEGTDPHSASRSDATHRGEKQIKVLVLVLSLSVYTVLLAPCLRPFSPSRKPARTRITVCSRLHCVR